MSSALADLLERKALCDKHPVKIDRVHVYGNTTEQHFDEIIDALRAVDVSTLKQRRANAKATLARWQGDHDVTLSVKAHNKLVEIISGETK